MVEIERKYLVAEPPAGFTEQPSSRIRQGYLAVDEDGTEVRVRTRDGAATLTVKRGAGMVRAETEIAIEPSGFDRLWPLTDGRRIEKTRYALPTGDEETIELDVYAGALAGLVIAEVEFADAGRAGAFTAPAWFGPEVTGDARYRNQVLARAGAPDA